MPTGIFSLPIYLTERLLGRSGTFQAAVGTSDSERVKQRIFLKEFDFREPRPCACLSVDALQFQQFAGGDQNQLWPTGAVFLYLGFGTNAANQEQTARNNRESFYAFGDFLGGVLEDMATLSGADQTRDTEVPDSELAINALELLGYGEAPEQFWGSEGRFWHAGIMVRWGDAA